MISDQAAEVCAVAKFFRVSPNDVWRWTNPDYLDAVEYMAMCDHVEWESRPRKGD